MSSYSVTWVRFPSWGPSPILLPPLLPSYLQKCIKIPKNKNTILIVKYLCKLFLLILWVFNVICTSFLGISPCVTVRTTLFRVNIRRHMAVIKEKEFRCLISSVASEQIWDADLPLRRKARQRLISSVIIIHLFCEGHPLSSPERVHNSIKPALRTLMMCAWWAKLLKGQILHF